jgi:hypothetical protein
MKDEAGVLLGFKATLTVTAAAATAGKLCATGGAGGEFFEAACAVVL